ncbi:uroporphyrinogen-III synthase [Ramlibacter sp. 2FC]|uniref:uroporphyrinogen-III synthase n=1 Tax=Ramlibacter sp. 2FC TaxID=2502188 RepID=UPI0010F80773|nr:uroporphyrinogen-III synthase [Ramlibacter sp. 2FC]
MPEAPFPRVLVTRPPREAAHWVTGLRQRGLAAEALPLIAIAPAPDPGPLRQAWRHVPDYAAVMFVSGNAVSHFFAEALPEPLARWRGGQLATRAWSPGPGTSEALRQAGLAAAQIDAPPAEAGQFDSEALWARVQARLRAGQRVLIVRGSDAQGRGAGRDWLAQQLAAAGVAVDQVLAYRRLPPALDAAQLALAGQAARDGSVWLFSSSEAIAQLLRCLPAQDWSRARALATHPRIAEAARRAGFGVVCESRPALAEVVASIESLA